MMSIGSRIIRARESETICRSEFADKCGIDLKRMVRIESDLSLPTSAELLKIADILKLPVDYFLRPDDPLKVEITKRK